MPQKERYTKQKIYVDAMNKIKEYQPANLIGLISLLDCGSSTFYNKIKVDSKEYLDILEALKREKEKVANTLRKKLVDNDNPTAIIAALKLYGNDEDRLALNQQNIDLKASGKIDYQKVTKIEGNLNKLNEDELKLLNELLEKIKE
jgi:NAD-dependent SIR2 family protein deacetylase